MKERRMEEKNEEEKRMKETRMEEKNKENKKWNENKRKGLW